MKDAKSIAPPPPQDLGNPDDVQSGMEVDSVAEDDGAQQKGREERAPSTYHTSDSFFLEPQVRRELPLTLVKLVKL